MTTQTVKLNPKYFKVPTAKVLYTIYTAEGDIDGFHVEFDDGSTDDVWIEETFESDDWYEAQINKGITKYDKHATYDLWGIYWLEYCQ